MSAGGDAVALVMAKAPVAGRVKTRLGRVVGDQAAAALATAALLDTLAVCTQTFGAARCYLALDGDLSQVDDSSGIVDHLEGWTVLPQRGDGFAQRLAHAHAEVAGLAGAPVVQVGMDTPQASRDDLDAVAGALAAGADAVLGRAPDGGWWVLGLARPELASVLEQVEMSTEHTGDDTRAVLVAAGARVATTSTLTDVDEVADADEVAHAFPTTRFARTWTQLAHAEVTR